MFSRIGLYLLSSKSIKCVYYEKGNHLIALAGGMESRKEQEADAPPVSYRFVHGGIHHIFLCSALRSPLFPDDGYPERAFTEYGIPDIARQERLYVVWHQRRAEPLRRIVFPGL